MKFEIVNPDDVDEPINDVPMTWNDEKPHSLISHWSEEPCWCEPRMDGKYVRHRSVFDAIEEE